jgi:hypothetical protein
LHERCDADQASGTRSRVLSCSAPRNAEGIDRLLQPSRPACAFPEPSKSAEQVVLVNGTGRQAGDVLMADADKAKAGSLAAQTRATWRGKPERSPALWIVWWLRQNGNISFLAQPPASPRLGSEAGRT